MLIYLLPYQHEELGRGSWRDVERTLLASSCAPTLPPRPLLAQGWGGGREDAFTAALPNLSFCPPERPICAAGWLHNWHLAWIKDSLTAALLFVVEPERGFIVMDDGVLVQRLCICDRATDNGWYSQLAKIPLSQLAECVDTQLTLYIQDLWWTLKPNVLCCWSTALLVVGFLVKSVQLLGLRRLRRV